VSGTWWKRLETAFKQSYRTIMKKAKMWQRNFKECRVQISLMTAGKMKQGRIGALFIVLFIMCVACTAHAQQESKEAVPMFYDTGIGVRAGNHPGFTLKHFLTGNGAVNGLLQTGYKYRGWNFTALYEHHSKAFGQDNMRWFYGGGVHVGIFSSNVVSERWGYYYAHSITTGGVDAIAGIEYRVPMVPFAISLDVKPYYDIIDPSVGWLDGGLSLRYTFKSF
jgi:hypothetical protein